MPFQYAEEKKSTGMTALAGLATYLDLFEVADLRACVQRHVGLREGGQGWTASQMITSLILLNLLPFAVLPIASILYNLTANLVLVIFGTPGEWPATVALIVLPAILVDSVAGVLIFWLINFVRNQFVTDATY